VTQAAHAKLNLTLAVTGTRPDGYHELSSVFLRIALHDMLTVEPLDGDGDEDALRVEPPDPSLPLGASNLVLRATATLRAHLEPPLPPLRFVLTKRIPIAAGLGGGSSDAATALLLAADAWHSPLPPDLAIELGARVGSDVPFFVAGDDAALVTGRGERIETLPPPVPPVGILLLVVTGEGLSTAEVFAAHDRRGSVAAAGTWATALAADALTRGVAPGDLAALASELRDGNDLWPSAAALRPTLAEVRRSAEDALGRPVLLSGSGPTLFALYPSLPEAEAAVASVTADPALSAHVRALATATTAKAAGTRDGRSG
jgi:4-diphosphocytidyl-2-C-methyl-D-erythritol kinase